MSGKVLVTRVVVAMAAMVPGAVFASLPLAAELCASGDADPVAFTARADFEDAVGSMAPVCPEVVLMLLQKPAQTIPELGGGASDDEAPVDDGVGDTGETVSALGAALAALTQATADVTTAQAVLEQATVRVRLTRHLRDSLILASDTDVEVEPRILADFTDILRTALVEYQAAKDDLDSKSEALDTARGVAIEAFDIRSLEAAKVAADEGLIGLLDGAEYADLRTQYEAAVAAASGVSQAKLDELTALQGELGTLADTLEALGSRDALVTELDDSFAEFELANDEFSALEIEYRVIEQTRNMKFSALMDCNRCQSAVDEYSLYFDTVYEPARVTFNDETTKREGASEAYLAADAAVQAYDRANLAIGTKTLAIAVAQAAYDEAGDAVVAANESLGNLTGLKGAVVAAGLALEAANEQVAQDTGVVAAQGAVRAAEMRLVNAIERAVYLLEGSEEEAAAKAAIVTAQAALDAALTVQAEAVAAAGAAMETAEGVDAPEVVAAVAELDAALGAADAADETALAAGEVAVAVLQDHADAKEELRTELVEDGQIKPEPQDWDHTGDGEWPEAVSAASVLAESVSAESVSADSVSTASVSDDEGAASVTFESGGDGVTVGAEGGETAGASEGEAGETSSGGESAEGGAGGDAGEASNGGEGASAGGETAGGESEGDESAGGETAGGAGDGADAEPAAEAPAADAAAMDAPAT